MKLNGPNMLHSLIRDIAKTNFTWTRFRHFCLSVTTYFPTPNGNRLLTSLIHNLTPMIPDYSFQIRTMWSEKCLVQSEKFGFLKKYSHFDMLKTLPWCPRAIQIGGMTHAYQHSWHDQCLACVLSRTGMCSVQWSLQCLWRLDLNAISNCWVLSYEFAAKLPLEYPVDASVGWNANSMIHMSIFCHIIWDSLRMGLWCYRQSSYLVLSVSLSWQASLPCQRRISRKWYKLIDCLSVWCRVWL